jgi:hypothetical protein
MNISFETKGDFNNLQKWLEKTANYNPKLSLQRIGNIGEKELAKNTPKDTSETASSWRAEITRGRNSIFEIAWYNRAHPHNGVNLATLLDQGYFTGTGGYVPPRPYIQRSMESIWKDAGNKIAKEMTE